MPAMTEIIEKGVIYMLPLNIDVVQILLHMLNFVILAGGLTLLLFKPVSKFMAQRREHFEHLERENAEKAAENERIRNEYEQKLAQADVHIAQMRAEAEKQATKDAKTYIDSAKEKAAAIISDAEIEAEQRRKQILDSAQTEIGELVVEATQKLIAQSSSPERNKRLYDEFIKCAEGADTKA